ncbi:CxxxxCH/CxxCH domain c-type cytochrome [Geomesophilobacter sediminis]|uniref:CxxxxCH/CxxCH domain-containing protein n=1 Tax=Geomesophilobacter sediminis TaxID=2798584 RepID=A0A8J7JJN9_9BACT|nr:CxxxxCH/CxxCH domain-containing protein [Geomesophilobacter sediminis]MBJ6723110.1 CxxxxCH/CxxCH domain-containing protein [Geomesophilobacter sediminis]
MVVLACALPLAAHAATWFFSTQAKSNGGTITSPNMTGQRVVNGPIYHSYTTSTALPVTITADPGFSIRDVVVNNVSMGAQGSSYSTFVKGDADSSSQSVTASFAPALLSVGAQSSGYGGSISPSYFGNITYGTTLTEARTFYITPQSGFYVQSVTGVPSGATVSPSVPAGASQRVTVTFPKGYVFTTSIAINATFVSDKPVIKVSLPQSALVGVPVTLSATHVGGPAPTTYTWTQWSGPARAQLVPAQSQATVVAPASGYYVFRVAVDGGSYGLIALTVTDSTGKAARTLCEFCHQAIGIGTPGLFRNWSASAHRVNSVSCEKCHSTHPAKPDTSVCSGCHSDMNSHPFATGGSACTVCHNSHSLKAVIPGMPAVHFNNSTSVGYPASYVTSRSDCMDCHRGNDQNAAIRQQWKVSAHGATTDAAWRGRDFKTMSGCVQCHTTTGFIAYSTGKVTAAWGTASDKSKEVLACNACHSDIGTGAIRAFTPVKPYKDDSYVNRNAGESNICFDCHSGTKNGKSVTALANFGNAAFPDPHFLAAGGTLHAQGGYQFAGRSYAGYSSNSHRRVGLGVNTTAGPCIACHKSSASGHTFTASVNEACAGCHKDSLTTGLLSAEKGDFQNALQILRAQLDAKGFAYYSSASPRFAATNWGSGQSGADRMGAAFNYAFLRSEPGAYAHNSAYTKQLIFDSIDVLHNGSVTGSIDTALTDLVSAGKITQQAADQVATYKNAKTSCTTCHDPAGAVSGTGTGSHVKHASDGVGCADCHSQTATGATALVPGTVTHINGQVDVNVAAIDVKGSFSYGAAAKSCSNVTCHGNGAVTMTWGQGPASCESCHVTNISVVDGVKATDRSLFPTSGHGQSGVGQTCLSCHDSTKQHIGGGNMLLPAHIGAQNIECNVCHNDTDLIPYPARNNMKTHINADGTASNCTDCHDPHGTTNLSMIKTNILGRTITYTNDNTGLTDPVTNQGLCQVCHTQTKYYRAGVVETNHDTTGCLGCHQHNAAAGAFMVTEKKQCDSCHGYPPAPRVTSYPVVFGTMSNWSSATFEDYSGGGGAHLVGAHVPQNARRADGWANCVMCHETRYHPVETSDITVPILPSKSHITVAPQYRLDNSFTIYSGAKLFDPPARNVTGSCMNVSCHMGPSPRWSIER